MDLLDRAKELINQGSTQTNAHFAYLQTLSSQASPQPKAEVKSATPNSQNNAKNPNFNAFYLVGGLVLFSTAVLVIGY